MISTTVLATTSVSTAVIAAASTTSLSTFSRSPLASFGEWNDEASNLNLIDLPENRLTCFLGDAHEALVWENSDFSNLARGDSGFVGDCADQVTGTNTL